MGYYGDPTTQMVLLTQIFPYKTGPQVGLAGPENLQTGLVQQIITLIWMR